MAASLPVPDLARALNDAIIFASRDTTLPMINAVRLESTRRNLVAVATDRFTLGSSAATYTDGKGPAFSATLRLPHAQLLAHVAKSFRRSTFEDARLTFRSGVLTCAFSTGEKVSVPELTSDVPFPDWRSILRSHDGDGDEIAAIALNPAYMAKFSRVRDARKMVCSFSGPRKPVKVTIGDQFFGVCMPMHRESPAEAAPAYPDWLTVAEQGPVGTRAAS